MAKDILPFMRVVLHICIFLSAELFHTFSVTKIQILRKTSTELRILPNLLPQFVTTYRKKTLS